MAEEIKGGNNKLRMMASGLQTMLETWQECRCGLNGGPALKELERLHGARWRNNKVGGAGRQCWNRRVETCLEIEHRVNYMTEQEALDSLQLALNDTVKKGSSKKPNLVEFNNNLRKNWKIRESENADV